MSKDAFLRKLRLGLKGLPPEEIEEILSDYAGHFAESSAFGRQEAEVASALGDPARLARELKAEAGLRRFERHWSITNLLAAVLALAGLALVDILFLLPLLVVISAVTLALGIALLAIGALGLKIIFAALLFHDGSPLMAVLSRVFIGAGLINAFVGGIATLLLTAGAGVRILGHYTRLHFHLAQPITQDTPITEGVRT